MVLDDEEVHPTYDIGIWINTPFFAKALEDRKINSALLPDQKAALRRILPAMKQAIAEYLLPSPDFAITVK